MTASQPPQPPQGGGQPPQPGQQPGPGQPQGPPPGYQQGPPQQGPPQQGPPQQGPPPGYQQGPPPGYQQGPPPGYQQGPPPGYQQGPPPGYQQGPPPGYGQPNPYGQPSGSGGGVSFDLKRLTMASYVIAGGTLLFLVLALFPWYRFSYGGFVAASSSGFNSANVTLAFVLFLLATAWALLPAFADVKVPFPRAWVTVGLAGLGTLLTLFAWIQTFDLSFSIWALLGFLTAVAILLFAVLSLLPELKNRPALPGGLANAAQWANQQAPEFGQQPGQPGQQSGQPGPQYGAPQGQPGPQYGQQPPPPHAPPPPPAAPNGPGSPDRPAGN